jgi:hypothetical protein
LSSVVSNIDFGSRASTCINNKKNNNMAFNKVFVMLPVMLAARKLDGEDPSIVYWLRVAYGAIQTCCVILVAYTYIQATAAADNSKAKGVVYVSPSPQVHA